MTEGLVGRLAPSLAAALVLGAVSTVGDWIWQSYIPDGAVVPGVAHGALFFLIVAAVLARAAGTRLAARRLLPTLPLAGLVIAASFYPIAKRVGYLAALLATWTMMWLTLALLQRWARADGESLGTTLSRALLAALASGLAFWAVSGLWTDPSLEAGYPIRLLYWTFAFLPGHLSM